ncbi:P-loop containing nucleoside triphosphate hydrolase protein [Globomyces pollinis-pini]|nr:P-loop containing nucleoside triphosphate hydrolase protein [Globomyces pollinis-pini]
MPFKSLKLFWSNITFGYVNELIRRGNRTELKPSDFSPVEETEEAEELSIRLSDNLKRNNGNLAKSLWDTFGKSFSVVGFGFFIEIAFKIGEGYLLGQLLKWFQNPILMNAGYYYATGLVLVVAFHGFLRHWMFFNAIRIGMQVRIALTSTIYKKCLSLSTSHTTSSGLIVNLISSDVQKFEDASSWLNFIWVSPIELIVVWFFIYLEIGWSSLAPFITLALLFPLQAKLSQLFGNLRGLSMGLRDNWLKNISNMLSGVLVVKLYAWEDAFIKTVNLLRNQEIELLKRGSLLLSVNVSFTHTSPALLAIITFLTFNLSGGVLSPSNVFTVITYMNHTRITLVCNFPKGVQYVAESLVSLRRIEQFLSLSEIDHLQDDRVAQDAFLSELNDKEIVVSIQNATFSWEESFSSDIPNLDHPILHNISLTLRSGTLTAISGPVASGKSSLIQAILGEMKCDSGRIAVADCKIAYASQTPWIQSGTIKQNILFGSDYDPIWFDQVIKACAMERDISLFPNGVNTYIGERGVTLSGGQRARLALARAVYYNADLYLLDDPLAAVDVTVGKQLYNNCITGILKNKCVLLITQQVQLIGKSAFVMTLENGKLIAQTQSSASLMTVIDNSITELVVPPVTNEISMDYDLLKEELTTDMMEEESSNGSVAFDVYFEYMKSGSTVLGVVGFGFLMIIGQLSLLSTDWWLSHWSTQSPTEQGNPLYKTVVLVLLAFVMLFGTFRVTVYFLMCVSASQALFEKMLSAVFRSPMLFFQSNPQGRIMNRFSRDMALVDEMLPAAFFDTIACGLFFITTVIVTMVVVPYTIFLVPFLAFAFYKLQQYYLLTCRQVKRYESKCRSPVYAHVPSTLEGLTIIRSFTMEKNFAGQFYSNQNEHSRMLLCYLSCVRWLGLRLDLMVTAFLAAVTFGCVTFQSFLNVNPGLMGLLLTYLMSLCDMLQWCVRQGAETENLMISTERIFEYMKLPSEAPTVTVVSVAPNWPVKGEVVFEHMNLTYPNSNKEKPNPPTLVDFNITFQPGSRVGIVGRTGAGKSSLIQALFRIVEPSPTGSIKIDSVNTSDIGLDDLRSRISIIPQEPFCFKGTIRFNLDPFGKYTDEELWNVLELVKLKQAIESDAKKLDAIVVENGANWSVGERQLICLARAILRNSKLIVMDEATSSVDLNTDTLIQTMIRERSGSFGESTILTIAHRLLTVIDYDYILVLDQGSVKEYGKPWELLQNSSGYFYKMVQEMDEASIKELNELAYAAYKQ